MPYRARASRPAMYNTPQIRNGGFGALQVEAVTNRPLSIARRHTAASQLRMRDIEPDELSSSEWVRFLVMEETERDRWISQFVRRRRNSDESTSSTELDRETARLKEEEAREEAEDERRRVQGSGEGSSSSAAAAAAVVPTAATPAVSMWVRQFDEGLEGPSPFGPSTRRPGIHRRTVTAQAFEAPPTYETATRARARTPPPAYEPRSDDEGGLSPRYTRYPD